MNLLNKISNNKTMLDIAKHKTILIKILKDIFTDSTIGPLLGFKGGTAAYLFYGLDRFSVDLDFDLLDESKEKEIFEKVEEIAKEYGQIKEKSNKRHTLLIILSYSDKAQNIKLEINKRSFGSGYEVRNYLGISMLVMKKEDMFANKVMALYERAGRTNRDIYDVWFFLKNDWSINKKIVEDRSKMAFRELLKKAIIILEKVGNRNILTGMGELLDEKQKAWAKENLKKDTIFLLKLMLDSEKK